MSERSVFSSIKVAEETSVDNPSIIAFIEVNGIATIILGKDLPSVEALADIEIRRAKSKFPDEEWDNAVRTFEVKEIK